MLIRPGNNKDYTFASSGWIAVFTDILEPVDSANADLRKTAGDKGVPTMINLSLLAATNDEQWIKIEGGAEYEFLRIVKQAGDHVFSIEPYVFDGTVKRSYQTGETTPTIRVYELSAPALEVKPEKVTTTYDLSTMRQNYRRASARIYIDNNLARGGEAESGEIFFGKAPSRDTTINGNLDHQFDISYSSRIVTYTFPSFTYGAFADAAKDDVLSTATRPSLPSNDPVDDKFEIIKESATSVIFRYTRATSNEPLAIIEGSNSRNHANVDIWSLKNILTVPQTSARVAADGSDFVPANGTLDTTEFEFGSAPSGATEFSLLIGGPTLFTYSQFASAAVDAEFGTAATGLSGGLSARAVKTGAATFKLRLSNATSSPIDVGDRTFGVKPKSGTARYFFQRIIDTSFMSTIKTGASLPASGDARYALKILNNHGFALAVMPFYASDVRALVAIDEGVSHDRLTSANALGFAIFRKVTEIISTGRGNATALTDKIEFAYVCRTAANEIMFAADTDLSNVSTPDISIMLEKQTVGFGN